MSIFCQAGNTLHFCLVQNQQHEDVIGAVPFAFDSILAGRFESKSGIVIGVSDNNDKWATGSLEIPIPRFDQFSPDSLALAVR